MTRLGIIDLRLNNLGSLVGCARALKVDVIVCRDPEDLPDVDRLIIPGVGGYRYAMDHLRACGWHSRLQERELATGTPVLGICLGMHLLGEMGNEGGETRGLGVFPDSVRSIDAGDLPLPHIGWDSVIHNGDALFEGIPSGADFYFAHSYGYADSRGSCVIATTRYGELIPVTLRSGSVVGVQFHPEKSSHWGLRLLKNFLFGEV